MKNLFLLIALGSSSLLCAQDYQNSSWPQSNGGQGQGNNGNYQGNDFPQQGNRNQYYRQNQQYNQRDNQQQYNRGSFQQQDDQSRYQDDQQIPSQKQDQFSNNKQNAYNDNNLQDDNQKPVSDQEINKKISEALGGGWFSKGYQTITFEVRNGNVILRGNVETLNEKNKIEDQVKKIDGVKQVDDQINVNEDLGNTEKNKKDYTASELQDSEKKYPQDFAATNEDRQINAKIRNKLNNGWFSSGNQTLILRTTNGVVIIQGTVDKFDDIQKMNKELKDIEGIQRINNQLNVKNK